MTVVDLTSLPDALYPLIFEFLTERDTLTTDLVHLAYTCRALYATLANTPAAWNQCGSLHCTKPLFDVSSVLRSSSPPPPLRCKNVHCTDNKQLFKCHSCIPSAGTNRIDADRSPTSCYCARCWQFALRKAIVSEDLAGARRLLLAQKEQPLAQSTYETFSLVNTTIMGGAYGMTGRKPLHLAAKLGHLEMVQCLVQHGAHIDAVDMDGLTALHVAALEGHVGVCRFLRAQGAPLTWSLWTSKRTWRGRTAAPVLRHLRQGIADDLRTFLRVVLYTVVSA